MGEFNDNYLNDGDETLESAPMCQICDIEMASIRLMQATSDGDEAVIIVVGICKECFEKIRNNINQDPLYINNVVQYIRNRGVLQKKDYVITSTNNVEEIISLLPGIYKISPLLFENLNNNSGIDMHYINKEFYDQQENARRLVDGFLSYGKKNNMDQSPIENLNTQAKDVMSTHGIKKLKNLIDDTLMSPSIIFRDSVLSEKCPNCECDLGSFLKQFVPGCSYCFIHFFNRIKEYVDSVNSNMMVNEKNKESQVQKMSIKKQILMNEALKKESIAQKDWVKAAYYRDLIVELESKLNNNENNNEDESQNKDDNIKKDKKIKKNKKDKNGE